MIDIPELLDITLSTLDIRSLMACSLVCRSWHELAVPHLWRDADLENCEGMWPCRHKRDIWNDSITMMPFLEKYGRFLWYMHWPLHWMSAAFFRKGGLPSLKTLRIPVPAFSNTQTLSPEGIGPLLVDVSVEAFGNLPPSSLELDPPIYDSNLDIIRLVWHFILNSPSLQRIEFDCGDHLPPLCFQHQGKGPNPSTVMISTGGLLLKRAFQNLPQLRYFKWHASMNSPCVLMVLANVWGRSYTAGLERTKRNPMSLEFQSLDLLQFLSQDNRLEEAIWNLTNYNIRSFDVKQMNLKEMDVLMTIMPSLEELTVQIEGQIKTPLDPSCYLDSESWTPTLRHNSLKTMRLENWMMSLLSTHVIWENLERLEIPNQRLLWGLALILERMPNVQQVKITCSLYEHLPDPAIIQQLRQREAAATHRPLSVRSLVVLTCPNRKHSAILALLPRLSFLTHLELYVKRAPILEVIAKSCPELEHLKLHCDYQRSVGQQELHMILVACSKLKTVRTRGLELRAIDMIQTPMTCLGLQELEVMIKGIPRLTTEQARALRDYQFSPVEGRQKEFQRANRRHQRSIEMERQLMGQLARLTKLRVLILSRPAILGVQSIDSYCSSPSFTLESGFDLLEPLQALYTFAFENITHEMGLQELQWISAHWPNIVTVQGAIQTRFGQISCNSHTTHSSSSFRGRRGRGRGRGCSRGRGRGRGS